MHFINLEAKGSNCILIKHISLTIDDLYCDDVLMWLQRVQSGARRGSGRRRAPGDRDGSAGSGTYSAYTESSSSVRYTVPTIIVLVIYMWGSNPCNVSQ